MGRGKSFLDASLKIDGIIDVLRLTAKKPIRFTVLRDKSRIKMQLSFLKYLNYCMDQEFMTKKESNKTVRLFGYEHHYNKRVYHTHYSITAKGRKFLELVK